MAHRHIESAGGDERLVLRMQLVLQRLKPQSAASHEHYEALAQRLEELGDRPGSLIATSLALGVANFGGDVEAAVAAYERLTPAIHHIADPLEQHVAMAPSLFLYHAAGNAAAYMHQACRMLQLANEVSNDGMRSASLSNVGIAFFLSGDELQARHHLEQSLESTDVGGWTRFGAVTVLADLYASAGEMDKVLPLLKAWSFPRNPEELDISAMAHFHALGAEVCARLGEESRARDYLEVLDGVPQDRLSHGLRCMAGLSRALHHRAAGRPLEALEALDGALALVERLPGSDRALPSRFWWLAAELAEVQGEWERAYRLLQRARGLELGKKQQIAAVRRVAAQFQTDANARAVEAAQRDPLTGLGNRERLIHVGDGWILRRLTPLVAKLNVRRFNAINEALGREIGDAVLQAVADRLRQACARLENALAGRVYADQFALVVAGEQADVHLLRRFALELFSTPLEVAGQQVDISAAWGIAHGPVHGASMQQLMSHAEVALHEDRRTHAGWTIYEPGLVRADPRQLSLISELRRAAQENEFTLLLQPKFSLSDNRVTSFESLIRWRHPSRGPLAPAAFIPFAENTGSIRGVTEWVLRRSMQLSVRLRGAGLVSRIAVNVSVHDVGGSDLCRRLQGLLLATGARAEDIRLELTESAVMKDPATVIDRMREINALGFEWSVDDFGTGQSSLAYLHMLPVSELKIDRSFVRGAATSSTSLTLLKAAIDLGRNLGLSTVGEGAETAEEWSLLRDLGCSVAQGWFGASPMPEHELIAWLQQRAAAERL
ncbi:putative bifunctional diguanylate cyclase/phosphodiesterase [Roseateles cellulosilyticus]|uniref:EAL domain-containing protein n=1 Tax=Pelomonas cellulosilytica TaxID=2906762 RepID=A0ABS8XR01_9BURK|nr:EAL domain-containing protein [Pelomonas sp. P8]MCE4553026.1 EAL domain-containing protein [Pelomonas sp. P8]